MFNNHKVYGIHMVIVYLERKKNLNLPSSECIQPCTAVQVYTWPGFVQIPRPLSLPNGDLCVSTRPLIPFSERSPPRIRKCGNG